MELPRVLFFLSSLPRERVSIRGIREGSVAISGTHGSCLLVADGLAGRGHEVGVVIHGGQKLIDSAVQVFDDLPKAVRWSGNGGRLVWCSWGDVDFLPMLRASGAKPWMWIHTGVIPLYLRWLERGEIAGLIGVSDSARLSALHSSQYRRIGRVYNPLSPHFDAPADHGHPARQLVFSGYLGECKGFHRVLEMWPHVREQLPDATLAVAGSGRLYGDKRPLGPLGVAAPDFEARFLQPIVEKFGSLERSGIRMAGLLPPRALRDLYRACALGVSNLNWKGDMETFCCSAVEMLASALPVFGVARGALPESIGPSGGAFLMNSPDLRAAAGEVVRLLRDPERLQTAGESGRRYVRSRYTLAAILDRWEHLLSGSPRELHARTGPWALPRGVRYWTEISCGRTRLGISYEAGLAAIRAVCALAS